MLRASLNFLLILCVLFASLMCVCGISLPAAHAQSVEPIKITTPDPGQRNSTYQFSLPAAASSADTSNASQSAGAQVSGAQWLDTGVTVIPGDRVSITAKSQITLADNHIAGPEGNIRGWKDLLRNYPLNSANSGALIGRIGNSHAAIPFLIGVAKDLTPAEAGHLFLAINLTGDLSFTGSYSVTVNFESMATPGAPQAVTNFGIAARLFDPIPRRVEDHQGDPGDMVNFALAGSATAVQNALAQAGWVRVDKDVTNAVVHGLISTLEHDAYLQMPMSNLYLFGRPQDLSYARAEPLVVAAVRHHLRVWKSEMTVDGKPLWVGSCTHDVGFQKDARTGKMTHRIDADIDKERDFLLESLRAAGEISAAAYVTPHIPLRTGHTATGGNFHSDGRIVAIELADKASD